MSNLCTFTFCHICSICLSSVFSLPSSLPPSLSSSLSSSFPPLLVTDEEALAIVEKALESGSLKQRNAVTVVTGIMGSGKTWLLSRLFRIKPPDLYTSTGVAEKSFRSLMRRIADISSFDLLTLDQIFEFLAPLFLAGIPAADIASLAQSFTAMQASEPSQPPSEETLVSPPTTASPPSSSPSLLDVSSVEVSPPKETPSSKAMKGLVQKAKSSKKALVLELLHMIDTGGQPEFMEVMPCLIHNSDLTILVLDVTKSLDAYPTLTFHDDGTSFKKPIVSPRTIRQIIQQLARTMQAKRGKKKGVKSSKFLVIGTHKDCVDKAKLSEVLSALNEELKTIFLPAMEEELIVFGEGKIVCAVNLLNPDRDDEEAFDSIRDSIVSAGIGIEIDTPLCLFMFEQDAIKYAEEQKGKGRHVLVLSLEECLQVGARLKMGREMVQAALIYFHRHNVFLYFRRILPNLVFLDPQVPLDFVNAIVRFSYKAKSGAIGPLTAQQIRFCSEGILTEDLLQHECLSTSFIPNLYEPRHALNLFQHIFTIAPLSEDSTEAEPQIDPTAEEAHRLPSKSAQTSHSESAKWSFARLIQKLFTKSPPKTLTEPMQQPLATAAQSKPLKAVTVPGKVPQVGMTEYLMMCLLPDKSQSEVHDCLPSTFRVSPLLVRFSNDCAPSGSFGNTVSCLISSFKWIISRIQNKPTCLAHNIVTLRLHNAPVKVTLVNSTLYFEIHINAGNLLDPLLEKYCPSIRATIFAALKKVFQIMQFDDIEVVPAFLCSHDPTSKAHAATIFPNSAVTSESLLMCSETEDAIGELEWSQGVWFQEWHGEKQQPKPLPSTAEASTEKHNKATSQILTHPQKPKERLPSTEDQPTLPELIDFKTSTGSINIVKRIGTHYDVLGTLLLRDNDGAVTQSIRDQHHHDAAKINYEILKQWIQGGGRQPVQWSTLIDVLKKIELSELAKTIEESLQ